MATVLEQERGSDRCIPRAHVDRGSVLVGIQEDLCQFAVLEPAEASGVVDAPMLEAEQLVATPVRQPAAGFSRRDHWKSSKLSPGGPSAGARPFDLPGATGVADARLAPITSWVLGVPRLSPDRSDRSDRSGTSICPASGSVSAGQIAERSRVSPFFSFKTVGCLADLSICPICPASVRPSLRLSVRHLSGICPAPVSDRA